MPAQDFWVIGSTNQVTLEGLVDENGTAINDATVSGQLKRDDNSQNVGDPISFSYVSASAGNYVGVVPADAGLVKDKKYNLFITATKSAKTAQFRIQRTAKYLDL